MLYFKMKHNQKSKFLKYAQTVTQELDEEATNNETDLFLTDEE